MALPFRAPVNHIQGTMVNPPNLPGWINVPIRDIIAGRTGIKTFFEKERRQQPRSVNTGLVKVTRYKRIFQTNVHGVGIGSGMVIEGKSSMAIIMEVWRSDIRQFKLAGSLVPAVAPGCLEAQADGAAAVRYVRERLQKNEKNILSLDQEITFQDVSSSAKKVMKYVCRPLINALIT